MLDYSIIIPAIITVVSSLASIFITWRVAVLQVESQHKERVAADESNEEIEFQKRLLELIEKQDVKLQRQDTKLEEMTKQSDETRALSDTLKRANLSLTIENQHLKRRLAELEVETMKLRQNITPLLSKEDSHE